MKAMNLIIAGFAILHMIFAIFFTQKIYSRNKIFTASLITLILPFLLLIFYGTKIQFAHLNASLISFYCCILLYAIKKEYQKINNYFISRGKISESYKNKDFTFVTQTEEGVSWDTDISSKPSWLDNILSFLLLILPILLFAFLNFCFSLMATDSNFYSLL
jgi:hypothetical protein